MTQTSSRFVSALLRALLGLTTVGALVFTIEVALGSITGQNLDQVAMDTVRAALADPSLMALGVLGKASVTVAGVLALAAVSRRVTLRDWRLPGACLVLVLGANTTTQVLKRHLLERPDFGWGVHNSLPSGHTTMVAAFAAVILLCLPTRWRPGGVLATSMLVSLTALSTVIAGWHRPADVLTALLVTFVWTAGVSLVLAPVSAHPTLFVVPGIAASILTVVVLMVIEMEVPSIKGSAVLFVLGICVAAFAGLVVRVAPDHP